MLKSNSQNEQFNQKSMEAKEKNYVYPFPSPEGQTYLIWQFKKHIYK